MARLEARFNVRTGKRGWSPARNEHDHRVTESVTVALGRTRSNFIRLFF